MICCHSRMKGIPGKDKRQVRMAMTIRQEAGRRGNYYDSGPVVTSRLELGSMRR